MPEPDFEQIARGLAEEAGFTGQGHITSAIAEQLRQVWNARGAADQKALDNEMLRVKALLDSGTDGDLDVNVVRVLKALDR